MQRRCTMELKKLNIYTMSVQTRMESNWVVVQICLMTVQCNQTLKLKLI